MIAASLALPIGIAIIITVHNFLYPVVHDRWSVTGLGLCLAICAAYVLRGVDMWFEKKRDNPPTFDVPQPLEQAFGTAVKQLRDWNLGPFSWNVRVADQEDRRVSASLSFTEVYNMAGRPMQQLQRLIMLNMAFEDLPEEEQKPQSETLAKMGVETPTLKTKVKLTWHIDSPANRVKCNEVQDELTADIKRALGVAGIPEKKEPNIFMPPIAVLIMTGMAAWFTFERFNDYQVLQTEKLEQIRLQQERQNEIESSRRQEAEKVRAQQEAYQRQQEEAIRRYRDSQERSTTNTNSSFESRDSYSRDNDSFAPILSPGAGH